MFGPGCTVAIAMISGLKPEIRLPGKPDHLFGLSDTSTIRQLIYGGGGTSDGSPLVAPMHDCLKRGKEIINQWNPALGWSQAGTS